MNLNRFIKIERECILLLFDGSRKAIPFNIVLATLLAIDLIYNKIQLEVIAIWFSSICIISAVRWFYCGWILSKGLENVKTKLALIMFFTLTLLMGLAWGACYLIAIPHLSEMPEFIILLVFAGMCAGALASLSIWLPAYVAYIAPIFLPVIYYNFATLNLDRSILASMCSLFVIMLCVNAKLNNTLLNKTVSLSSEKESLIGELKVMAITDDLTGLYNRRYFEDALQEEINRGKRNGHSLNLISIDVDNFKLVNDNFGHPYGDKFLKYIAELLNNFLSRANDTTFRLGGDEFAAILVNVPVNEVLGICNKIKKEFNKKILVPESYVMNQADVLNLVTLSIGVVYIPFNSVSTIANVVIAADQALYQSKQQGKNQIILKKLD